MANDARADTEAIDFRALLESERGSLERQLEELGFGGVSGAGLSYDSNFADSSQVTAERGEAESLATELRSALAEVEGAIVRLDAGTYGVCTRCGQPIGVARLEAKPAVTTCIACAQLPR
ncbi:MAG TPA: TraR/DksA C4-type zinc finger protein [Acidimicrobiales bacterium]|nr:TraR/DksA C4-type zinc finger protein [Acidimicrobiales bacterium]